MACASTELAAPTLSNPAATSSRIPYLDGIRGLAIGLVLLWHGVFAWLNAANHPGIDSVLRFGRLTWSGVDLFFVLSGFLIGGILLDARDAERYFQTFYLRRAHRIVPLYAVALVLLLPLAANRVPIAYYASFLQNIWMARHGEFGSIAFAVTWSLAVEEQFYLTLPAVVRYVLRPRLWYVVGGMIVAAPLLRIVVNQFPHGVFVSYVLAPCRGDALGCGVAAALLVRSPRLWSAVLERRGWLYGALGGASLLMLALLGSSFIPFSNQLFGLEYSLLALFYFLLLLSVLVSDRLQSVFSSRGLVYMGTIAYGLYLLHFPVITGVRKLVQSIHPRETAWIHLVESLAGIGLAFVAAAISWRYLEKPLIRRGHRYRY